MFISPCICIDRVTCVLHKSPILDNIGSHRVISDVIVDIRWEMEDEGGHAFTLDRYPTEAIDNYLVVSELEIVAVEVDLMLHE